MTVTPLPPVPQLDPTLIRALHTDLENSGWADFFINHLSPAANAAFEMGDDVPAMAELEEKTDPASTLTRLFTFSRPVAAAHVQAALPTLGVEDAKQLGLIEETSTTQTEVAALFNLERATIPSGAAGALWIVSDRTEQQTHLPPHPNQVLGITGATRTLSALIPEEKVENALDLGTGCGFLALQMSGHAQTVTATDISARACSLTHFNAALNSKQVEVRRGSLFDPVKDEPFDLIVSNPPFVITPARSQGETAMVYRDAGLEGDTLMREVIEGAVERLEPGGQVRILGNWAVRRGSAWQDRPKAWVEEASRRENVPIDAYIVQRDLLDTYEYTRWWLRDGLGKSAPQDAWERHYLDWIDGFKSMNVTEVGLGFVAMTRPNEEDLEKEPRLEEQDVGEGGTVLCEFLPNAAPFDAASVERVLKRGMKEWKDTPFRLLPGAYEQRTFTPGEPDPRTLVVFGEGPGSSAVQVPAGVSAFVGVCDGDLLPSQVIPAIAYLLDVEVEQVEREVREYLPVLIRAGVLQAAR